MICKIVCNIRHLKRRRKNKTYEVYNIKNSMDCVQIVTKQYKEFKKKCKEQSQQQCEQESHCLMYKERLAGRQGEEREKFPTPTKPVQSPAACLLPPPPPPKPLRLPSKGGEQDEVSILAFLLS